MPVPQTPAAGSVALNACGVDGGAKLMHDGPEPASSPHAQQQHSSCSRPEAAGAQWPGRPARSGDACPAGPMSEAGKGSPVKVKLPAVSSSGRTNSPARPWKPSAPGALSPGIAGSMPILPSTSPSPSNASPMLRHTLSARGAATAGSMGDPSRLLALQEDTQLCVADGPARQLPWLSPSSPIMPSQWHSQQQQQHAYSSSGNSSSGGSSGAGAIGNSSSGGGGAGSSSSSSNGGSSGMGGLGPRAPSGGGAAGSSYLGGLGRDGTESPSRPRRAVSAPGAQLHQYAVQHVLQQKAAAGAVAAYDANSTSSPRCYNPSSLAARKHPNFTNIQLDVDAAAAAAGPEGQPTSSGRTPGSACDTPDSQSSPHSCVLESPSSHQFTLSRLGQKHRPPSSSSGGSTSSTPHSAACPAGGGGSSSSTPHLQPHPPQSVRKAAKPPMAGLGNMPVGSLGAVSSLVQFDCSSPVDSPRMAAAASSSGGGGGGGGDTPGGSVYVRRGRYSLSGAAAGPELVVGSLGSGPSSSMLFGGSSGRLVGASGLQRSSSGIEGSAPSSPVPNMVTRVPSSSGSHLMGSRAELGSPAPPLGGHTGSSAPGEGGCLTQAYSSGPVLVRPPSSSGRDSSSGGTGGGGSGGVAPLLSSSYSCGSTAFVGFSATASPRNSFSGGNSSEGGPQPVGAAAVGRPGSGKKTTVELLVEAVCSRDVGRLACTLEFCKGGRIDALNTRCETTDKTALHEAVSRGYLPMVQLLLEAHSNPDIGHPKLGSPLLEAAARGFTEIVQLLLDAGADPNAVDVKGMTALHHAFHSGHVEVARLLVSKGADLTARTHNNEAPMDLASKSVQLALFGAFPGGDSSGPEPSPTTAAAAAAVAAMRRGSLDGGLGRALLAGGGSGPSSTGGGQGLLTGSSMADGSHPTTPTGSTSGRLLQGSSQANTPRAAAAAAQAAAVDFGARIAAVKAEGSSLFGGAEGGPASAATSAVSSPVRATHRSSSCNGLAASGTSGSIGGSSSSGGGGGFVMLRRASSSSSGGLMPLNAGLGGGGGGGLLALVGSGLASGSGSTINSPNGVQQHHHHALGGSTSSSAVVGGGGGGGCSGSTTPAGGAPGPHSSSSSGGGVQGFAAGGFATPPVSPSSVADAGPTGRRRPSPPVGPSGYGNMARGRMGSGVSSDGGSTPGDGGATGLPSALPSGPVSSSDQLPEDRMPTPPPQLQLPYDRFRNPIFKQRLIRPPAKGPLALEDTGRREQEDDQGPPAATAAAAAGAQPATPAAGPSSACSSSSQPTPAGGPDIPLSGGSSTVDLTAPTPHGTSILSGAAGSSLHAPSNSGNGGSGTASNGGKGGSSSGAVGGADAAGAADKQQLELETDMTALTLTDLSPEAFAPPHQQQQQQEEQQQLEQQQLELAQQQQPQADAQPQAAWPTAQQQDSAEPAQAAADATQEQQAQQQQQTQAAAPAGQPVFKFGWDPGSNNSNAAQDMAAAAAAATAAAVAGVQPRASEGASSSSTSSSHNPWMHTFRLHLADSMSREQLQQLQQQQPPPPQQQQQQQQVTQQEQHSQGPSTAAAPAARRNPQDPRFPPLLQGQTPPGTPEAATPAAAADFAVLQPERLLEQQQQQDGWGHAWEVQQSAGGKTLHWRRGELLGEGAYGKVYAGLNQETGELMAVKTLQLLGRQGSSESQAQLRELKQELECYQHLSHTHIVGYIGNEFDKAKNCLYIFLEYVPGGSISSMLQRFGSFEEDLARKYTRQLLLGLEYLHNKQIVHRDLKGGNALVTRDGIVKLTDFGASKPFSNAAQTDMMKSLRGSAFWMAPEVFSGKGYGRKADIWSLGCTVLEMLTAKHPWPDVDNQFTAMMTISKATAGPPRPAKLSAAASDFLDQCFKVDPRERSSASQLLQHPWVAPAGSSSSSGGNTRTRAALSSDESQA